MKESIWRTIAIAMITLCTGAFGTWASLGDKPSKEEVREMIRIEAPSALDVKSLRDEIIELKVEQARTSEKLELLLKKEGVIRQ